ncbi:MAG: hypothetical protein PSU94_12345 [Lacunisphaera sp.]|nr:hypothetical protein [Lacunisphaera sp.]
MTSLPTPRGLSFWMMFYPAFEAAANTASKRIHLALRPHRRGSYKTRRPGHDTPMWNVFAHMIKTELRPYGSKVRLARYLGIPKQRLQDFLNGRSRLPDAELTLRMLHWLAAKRDGKDHSI